MHTFNAINKHWGLWSGWHQKNYLVLTAISIFLEHCGGKWSSQELIHVVDNSDNFSQFSTCIYYSPFLPLPEVVSAAQKNHSSLLLFSCTFCNTLKSGSKLYYIIVKSLGFFVNVIMVFLTKNLMLLLAIFWWSFGNPVKPLLVCYCLLLPSERNLGIMRKIKSL